MDFKQTFSDFDQSSYMGTEQESKREYGMRTVHVSIYNVNPGLINHGLLIRGVLLQ